MTFDIRRGIAAAALIAALAGASTASAQKPTKAAPHNAGNAPAIPLRGLNILSPTAKEPPLVYAETDWRTPDPDNLLVIDTSKGRVIVELSPEAAPDSVTRIKTLTRQHFYDGLTFFRVLEDFMDQTGDPKNTGEGNSSLPDLKGEFAFRRGHGQPFVQVTNEDGAPTGLMGALPVQTQPDMIMAMTADGKATAWPLFCTGVMGMARGSGADSANSQFFLMRATSPSLNQRYAGIGRVIVGQSVVDAIKLGSPPVDPDRMTQVRLASDLPPDQRPKVRVLDPTKPGFQLLLNRTRADKIGELSVCDIVLPSQVQ